MKRKLIFVQNSLRICAFNIGETDGYRTTHPLRIQRQILKRRSLKTSECYQGRENLKNQDPVKERNLREMSLKVLLWQSRKEGEGDRF